ncbi:FecR family protein [Puteibacter caeruleilacunae]|nr:FecR family protein [Puteibacter caeruleilacunae]
MDIKGIINYLTNHYHKDNVRDTVDNLADERNNELYEPIFRMLWRKTGSQKRLKSGETARLNAIHHKINLSGKANNQKDNSRIRRLMYSTTMKVLSRAAVWLVIPFLSFLALTMWFPKSILINNQASVVHTEVVAPVGSQINLTLPDGSKVWLNHGSRLTYPQCFKGACRTVHLEGEGFFEVESDFKHPFFVETKKMTVKATGTKFNVKAYDDSPDFETTLVEGRVAVMKTVDEKRRLISKLDPNQHFKFKSESSKYIVKDIDPEKYIAWKDGKLMFEDDALPHVMRKLERWYNVDIIIEDEKLKRLTYKATFFDETLDQVLEKLATVSPIKYEYEKREFNENGTLEKRKVTIKYDLKN